MTTALLASPPTALPLGATVRRNVLPNSWADFFLTVAEHSHSLVVEVAATTDSPTGLGVYLLDAWTRETTAAGVPVLSGGFMTDLHAAVPSTSAAALDLDTVSRIGNQTHRKYFAYASECYLTPGDYYWLRIHGAGLQTVHFEATARAVASQLPLTNGTASVSGAVCDGKVMHHFFDFLEATAGGGVEVRVAVTRGELDTFHVRYERCAGAVEHDLVRRTLSGPGLPSASATLPAETVELAPGRYYVSVRGVAELCGEYAITVRTLTQVEVLGAWT
jgi:hypothetical protein